MRIEVRLCESLARHRRQGRAFALILKDGASVADALARLKLAGVGFKLALCNGATLMTGDGAVDGLRRLADGDHLVLGAAASGDGARSSLRFLTQRLSGLLSPLAQTS